jgi:hypothetical protein
MSKNMSRDRRGTGSGTDAETGPGQHKLNILNERKGGQNYKDDIFLQLCRNYIILQASGSNERGNRKLSDTFEA